MPIDEQVLIFDYDLEGRIEPNGEIRQHWENDALTNSLKMWISSRKGDIVRQPGRGGYLLPWLIKPLSENIVDQIEISVRDGLNQDFEPFLRIVTMEIIPVKDKRYWNFYLETYSPFYNIRSEVDENIRSQVT